MQEKNVQLGKFVALLVLATIIGGLWLSTAAEAKLPAPANRFLPGDAGGIHRRGTGRRYVYQIHEEEVLAPWMETSTRRAPGNARKRTARKTAFEAELMFTDDGVPITLNLHGRAEAGGPGSTLGASGLAVVEALAVKVNVSMAGQEFKKKAACVKEAKRINEDLGLE